MAQNTLDRLFLPVDLLDELERVLTPTEAWAVVKFMRYQLNKLPPEDNERGVWLACDKPVGWDPVFYTNVLRVIPLLRPGVRGFPWIEEDKIKATTARLKSAEGGRIAQLRRKLINLPAQTRPFVEGELGGGVASSTLLGSTLASGVEVESPAGGGGAPSGEVPFEGDSKQRREKQEARAPAPLPPSLADQSSGGADALGASSDRSGQSGLPSSAPRVLNPGLVKKVRVCPSCGELREGMVPENQDWDPRCAACDVWMEDPAVAASAAGEPAPTAAASSKPLPMAAPSVATPAPAKARAGNREQTRSNHRELPLPRVPGSKGRGAVAKPLARALVRKVQAALPEPGRAGRAAPKKAPQEARGGVDRRGVTTRPGRNGAGKAKAGAKTKATKLGSKPSSKPGSVPTRSKPNRFVQLLARRKG